MIFREGHQNPAGHREELMMDSRFGEAALTMTLAALVFGFAMAAHAQGKWRAGAPIPQGANEVIGAEIDGQVLVYGGQDPGNNAMGIFWKFDPTKNEWSKLASNPVPVDHGASASIGHKFYVFGGFRLPDTGKVGWYPENKAWAFDLDTQKWSALPPMPTTRGALAAGRSELSGRYGGTWPTEIFQKNTRW
jgi:N-acetylneuraminic acid mutarotase